MASTLNSSIRGNLLEAIPGIQDNYQRPMTFRVTEKEFPYVEYLHAYVDPQFEF